MSLFAFLCVLLLLTGVLLWSESTRKLDRLLHDSWVRASQQDTPEDIVIVGIDAQSLIEYGRWPWSRALQAQLLDHLARSNARAVIIDILYTEPAANPADDEELASVIRGLPVTTMPVLTEKRVSGSPAVGHTERLPIPALLPYVKIGHIQLTIDDDSIVRRVYLKAGYNAPHWPIMPLAALQALHPDEPRYFDENLPGIRTDREAYGEWLQDYEVMIPFYGPRDSFTTVSASQVLQGEVPASTFDDKIVFVGIASDGLEDMVPTPVSSLNRAMPGVEIHVNLFASIRDGLLVTPVNRDWNYIVALLVLPLLMLTYSRAGPEWSLAAALVASSVPIFLSYIMYEWMRMWYPPLSASVPILISYLAWSGNRLRFVNRFLANQSRKLESEQAPRDRHTDEDLTQFFAHATQHLPVDGWRFSTRSQSHVGGDLPPPMVTGLTEAWVRRGDIYARRFPTDDRLDIMLNVPDPNIASELTRYIDRLSRVRRRIKPSVWRGSVEQLQSNALKLGDQLDWLRAVKSFSDSILDGSPAGFVVWNMVGEPIRLNDLIYRLLPAVGKRPLLRDFIERVGQNLDDESVREQYDELMHRGVQWQYTVQQDDRELLVGLSAVGRTLAERLICATVIDVSEIRIAERARAEMMDYLSHDLRSPLVSSLYLLDADSDVSNSDLISARRNIQSSLTMMDNLLHMARADTVSVDTFKELLLDNVIDNAVTHFLPQAAARNITVEVSVCDDELWMYGDASLLDRAIGNLMSNSIKYSAEGGNVWLSVTVEDAANGDGQDAVVTVKDDGVGIDPAIIDTLFTRFKRDPSVADKFKGIGLGLALVARVAHQHGGTVTAHSSGKGAEFVFRLPLGINLDSTLLD